MLSDSKQQLISGIFWSFIGQFGYWIVALVANIFLARILTIYQFGQIGIVFFFVNVGRVLSDAGMGGALVRNNEASQKDYSTVFLFNLFLSVFIYIIICLSAQYISVVYNDGQLKNILIVCSLVIVVYSFQLVQSTRLIKKMGFRRKSVYEFSSILVASIIGIVLALKGFGVWSLVSLQLLTAIFQVCLYWIFEGGIGPLVFDRNSYKQHYKFGLNTTASTLINTIFENIYQLILGKYFALSQTGLYFQAKKLQDVPAGVTKTIISSVVFSSFSKLQNDKESLTRYYRKIITLFTVLYGFICLLIFYYSESIISILLGDQWLEAVFYLKVLIVASFFYMQEVFNRNIFKIFDKTEKLLYLEIFKKVIQTITIIIGLWFSNIEILLYGFLLTSVISFLMNHHHAQKIKESHSSEEIYMVFKVFGIAMGTILLGQKVQDYFILEGMLTLLLVPFFIVVFFLMIRVLKISNLVKDIKGMLVIIKFKPNN